MSETGYTKKIFIVLKSPKETFKKVSEKDYLKGLTLILLIATLAAASRYLYLQKAPINIPDNLPNIPDEAIKPTNLQNMLRGIGTFAEFIRYLIELPLLALLVFTTGKITTGEGKLKKFIAQIGLTYSPLLLQQLIRIVYSFMISTVAIQALQINRSQPAFTLILTTLLDIFNFYWITTLALIVILYTTEFKVSGIKALVNTLVAFVILILVKAFTFI